MAASESLRALSAADAPEAEEARLCGECRGPMVPVRHEQRAGRIAARLRIADVRSSGTQAREYAPRRASIGKERQSQAPVQPCHVRTMVKSGTQRRTIQYSFPVRRTRTAAWTSRGGVNLTRSEEHTSELQSHHDL